MTEVKYFRSCISVRKANGMFDNYFPEEPGTLLRIISQGEATDLGYEMANRIENQTLAPKVTQHAGDVFTRIYNYEGNCLKLSRGKDFVQMTVTDRHGKHAYGHNVYRVGDTAADRISETVQTALSYLHKVDEQATETRAEPARNTPTKEMNIAQSLREKEGNILQERKQQRKELKKLAKAFSRVMLEEMTVKITDPERINRGTALGSVPFSITTREPDLLYTELLEVMSDTGFALRKTESRKNMLLVNLSY